MHSHNKSKLFKHQLLFGTSATSSGLPLATICLLSALLLDQMIGTSALKCYQSQTTLQQPITGSATDCPMMAWSCIKSVDYSQGLVTRACQSSNCTSGVSMSSTPICQNSSSYPPQTFCCCYGDGCNSSWRPLVGNGLLLMVALGALAFGGILWNGAK